MIGAVVLGLVLVEAGLRVFLPLRAINENFTVYDATYGKRFKKNLHTTRTTSDFTATFSTNQLGFRGRTLHQFPKGSILVLGDSFALGYGVSDGLEFPALVERTLRDTYRLDDVAVVNAAIGDTGTGRWLKFLRNDAGKYQPRLIVLQLTGSDFADDLREDLFDLGPGGSLIEKPVPRPDLIRRLRDFFKDIPALRSLQILALARTAAEVASGPVTEENHADAPIMSSPELTERIVEQVLLEARTREWPLLGLSVNIEGERFESLSRLFRAHGSDLIAEPDKIDRPNLYYPNDEHWNELGNRAVADLVLRWLLTHREAWLDDFQSAWNGGAQPASRLNFIE
jgi:lysophospholipase L1-like esterase